VKLSELFKALDSLARTGWMIRGIPAGVSETVSQHIFKTALITLILSEKLGGVDKYRAVSMALVHDLIEAYTGDIAVHRTNSFYREIKEKCEMEVFEKNTALNQLVDLFREYVEGSSREAKLVKLADRLATYLKALEYLEKGYDVHDIVENTKLEINKLSRELSITNVFELVDSV